MTGYTEDDTQPSKEFKDKMGTPLGRTGNAIDYAQRIERRYARLRFGNDVI